MMALLIFSLIVLVLVILHTINNLNFEDNYDKFVLHNNDHVPIASPPDEIIIEANELSCHDTPTPCTSNADCQLCVEGLASCQHFLDTVLLELPNDKQLTINPGESYCLALDNRRARSCNPNTGTWVLRQVDSSNFALICMCNTPGLVTQLNIYEDCTLAVGCLPHGIIEDINASPLMCNCNSGYVPALSETNTPYCRPKIIRDIILEPEFYARPPCDIGFISSDSEHLDPIYRMQIGANICLPDPCSIDPITGIRHSGYLNSLVVIGNDLTRLTMCQCPISDGLYPVHNSQSMLASHVITNACIQPLLNNNVRRDLKLFWARGDLVTSDADIVINVDEADVRPEYRQILFRRLTPHPSANVTTPFLLKFQIESQTISLYLPDLDVFQGYWRFTQSSGQGQCPVHGIGQCTADTVCGNLQCNPNYCIGSSASLGYRRRCYLFLRDRSHPVLDRVKHLCIWNYPTFYNKQNVPVTLHVNVNNTYQVGLLRHNREVHFVTTENTMPESQYDTAIQLMATYPNYNS
ncbi:hypothetical protein [Phthorimaea operculella granulovirus]|uniref:Per os infectivity factor 1 n=1 Tax=Phthorimaea operculella granulovirus TaxID=192584 RepID=Q8JRZ2_9BBAC|nr:hypothetical protein [Phthorimaea operculella granulovirus]AAM70265.1 hypothetical protein [Phthorimaea operculella granulovirus]QBH65902.1 hypothetical protein PhopGVgp067 [Phthorimaea operculella granulovirus]QBH66032.1 hypothetical protein PhopGVgp067 [Phthorimaea operculella granulovirus]QBH66162.1 hypothetical protein PhopGVgp067 [Phthorimaea operculella granulovirus]QBH66292.1 hypothetical protein PhopGVgp067 [Phthorimaea operculella granulovirus]